MDEKEYNLEIEKTVILNFIMSLKERDFYHYFREQLYFEGGVEKLYRLGTYCFGFGHSVSPFSRCKDIEEIANKLVELTKQVGFNLTEGIDKFERVTININHLLHFTLERVCPIEELQEIGQEVFEHSCLSLFNEELEE
jgi:uncharacterized Fe-S cluster-containing radical SAM superfamily protein